MNASISARSLAALLILVGVCGCGEEKHEEHSAPLFDKSALKDTDANGVPKVTTYTTQFHRGGSWILTRDWYGNFSFVQLPGKRVIVSAQINNSPPAPFILDTGAPETHVFRNAISGSV